MAEPALLGLNAGGRTLARVLRGLLVAALAAMLAAAWAGPGTAAGATTELVVTLDAPSAARAVRQSRALTRAARAARLMSARRERGRVPRGLGARQRDLEQRIERALPGAGALALRSS